MYSQSDKLAVVKVGGDMLLEKAGRDAFAENLKGLKESGWRCLVLHGGGPQISTLQALHGLTTNKVEGRRITSQKDLIVVKQALCGEVNVDLVTALISCEINAFGCHGASGLLLEANKRAPMEFEGCEPVDLGEVGDVVKVNNELIHKLLNLGLTPVIASLGADQTGRIYNINADTTAVALAKSLKADILILCTKVGGIFANIDDPSSRLSEISSSCARTLIEKKVITDGMIPKVREALSLLDQGTHSVAIVNADKPTNFVRVAQAKPDIGTRFLKD